MEALLVLEDGRAFRGRAFGAPVERVGEVVFHTGMTGYQEVLTDPSYHGQIVVMTSTQIGNVGTNPVDPESGRPWVEGFAVRELTERPSSWRATQGLGHYLNEHGIPGIAELDTRALTRHLRSRGAMRGALSCLDRDVDSLAAKARAAPRLEELDLVGAVSCREAYSWSRPREVAWGGSEEREAQAARPLCLAYDFGVKRTSLALLVEHGFEVLVVPAGFGFDEARRLAPAAVFLSNGPGDPATATQAIAAARAWIGRVPVFGICLGHQLSALALGGRTFKLRFGHHGANHPVRDLRTGMVAVTSQNHGYAVDPDTLPAEAVVTHVNLNDGTCEGFAAPALRLLTVQFHPESAPGPHDSVDLFREFRTLVAGAEVGAGPAWKGEP